MFAEHDSSNFIEGNSDSFFIASVHRITLWSIHFLLMKVINKGWLLLFLLLVLILQVRLWFGETGILSFNALEREILSTSHSIRQLWLENQRLKEENKLYQANPGIFEGLAREKLGFSKKHEIFIKIKTMASEKSATKSKEK